MVCQVGIEYAHIILHVSDHLPLYVMTRSYLILRAIPVIHEINALKERSSDNGWENSY